MHGDLREDAGGVFAVEHDRAGPDVGEAVAGVVVFADFQQHRFLRYPVERAPDQRRIVAPGLAETAFRGGLARLSILHPRRSLYALLRVLCDPGPESGLGPLHASPAQVDLSQSLAGFPGCLGPGIRSLGAGADRFSQWQGECPL